ncbi:uncharacterized protein BXZ73DRAFT_56849 [Epithele typhae]|uniref:uncharacterized protein n=1 Tax=Epithele typhae TaxID=378194 RepID=UPI00200865D5|nr:uncharacterized protein BXZ73DRAFT_56849 [Epithele typhae]KAH9911621.1 hypothetical protein BXZ73DRAFT_56849 [Epithele typhae]
MADEAYEFLLNGNPPPRTSDSCTNCRLHGNYTLLNDPLARYRCNDCVHHPNLCAECAISAHVLCTYHRLLRWDALEGTWLPTDVFELGFVLHLSHAPGEVCKSKDAHKRGITIVHEHGIIARATVQFCQCTYLSYPLQLLQHGLFPGTWDGWPQTAYTLQALEVFEHQLLQAQSSVHDIYLILRRLTNRFVPGKVKDRERELVQTLREYGYLQCCMRHGRKPGAPFQHNAMVTLCSACPNPGKNMRKNWEFRDRKFRFLDEWFLEGDGCFRQHLRPKPTDARDRRYCGDVSYFTSSSDVERHLARVGDKDKEPEDCHNFKASGHGGYTGPVTGVIAMVCRHGLVAGGSAINLNKGERFAYIHLALVSASQSLQSLKTVKLWYDVGCNLSVNLKKRVEEIQEHAEQLSTIAKTGVFPDIETMIGDFHIRAHKEDCHTKLNSMFRFGAARTGGEECEQVWSGLNNISNRTKEMNNANREDTLALALDDMNQCKIFNMNRFLVKCHNKAVIREAAHSAFLKSLEATIPQDILRVWRDELDVWLQEIIDPAKHRSILNPFVPKVAHGQTGAFITLNSAYTHGKFDRPFVLPLGRGLEATRRLDSTRGNERVESQIELLDAGNSGNTKHRKACMARAEAFLKKSAACLKRYNQAFGSDIQQAIHECLRTEGDGLPPHFPQLQAVDILLPSNCHFALRTHPLLEAAACLERAVREAQASEALNNVRKAVVLSHSINDLRDDDPQGHHKRRHRSAHSNPTPRPKPMPLNSAVLDARATYNRFRTLLLRLGMPPNDPEYRVLQNVDLRHFTVLHSQRNAGDTQRVPSWLWSTATWARDFANADQEAFAVAKLKVFWFISRSARDRWGEEVHLRCEEMYRTLQMWTVERQRWRDSAIQLDIAGDEGAAVYHRG